jgi:hypothetical protein
VPSDLAWRRDVLAREARLGAAPAFFLGAITSAAALGLAAFYMIFAIYIAGAESLAEAPLLGGLEHYADEVGLRLESAIVVTILSSIGLLLAAAAIARPVAPTAANAIIAGAGGLAVMFFWLGAWPLGVVAAAGAVLDMTLRVPHPLAE